MKISLVHYQPVEFYPPAMNLLNTLVSKYENADIALYTCKNGSTAFSFSNSGIKQFRYKSPVKSDNALCRIVQYLNFIFGITFRLILYRPSHLIYYETNSALPIFLYRLLSFRKFKLYIHYHEYNSREQYMSGMKLVTLSYLLEKHYLWKKANKISHTNKNRLTLFQNDYPTLNNLRIIPNYPPEAWWENKKPSKEICNQINLVYIGSLSLENFYLQEICSWIKKQNGKIKLNLYSFNATPEAIQFINNLQNPYIKINTKGIWYYNLPELLKEYHVGIILYRAFNQNFTFNETNKLFEYLSCGLDVWFSDKLKGINNHVTKNTYPQVVPINFENLEQFDYNSSYDRQGKKFKSQVYSAETVLSEFLEE